MEVVRRGKEPRFLQANRMKNWIPFATDSTSTVTTRIQRRYCYSLVVFETTVLSTHYAGRIWKRGNHRLFGHSLGQENHISVTPPFSKNSVFKIFFVHTRRNGGRVLEKRYRQPLFSLRIRVHAKPKRKDKLRFQTRGRYSFTTWNVYCTWVDSV